MKTTRVALLTLVFAFSWSFWCTDAHPQWSFDFAEADNNFLYGRYGQMGSRGFFGRYNVDASGAGNFANLNGWVGNRGTDIGQIVSGTNASLSSTSLAAQPRLGSDWVKVAGRYTIQSYQTSTSQGSYVAMSPGQLTLWTLAVNTPLGTISWGKQEFVRGNRLQFGVNRTEEYIALERWTQAPNILAVLVTAGMLPRAALSWFRPATWFSYYKEEEPDEYELDYSPDGLVRWTLKPKDDTEIVGRYASSELAPADLLLGIAMYPWQRIVLPGDTPVAGLPAEGLNPWNQNDLNADRVQNYALYFLYSTKDLAIGAGGLFTTFHAGPELQRTVTLKQSAPTIEEYISEGWIYFKYSNGRLFLTTELDWFNRLVRFQKSQNGTFFGKTDNQDGSGSLFAPRYQESWRYMVETGVLQGPSCVRFLYAFMPGPDRRHGILIDRQPFVQDERRAAFGVFEPYSILLSYYFGGGVNAPGYLSDASIFALKFDYALAANLLIEGSVLRAFRTSHGYGLGYIRPDPLATRFGQVEYKDQGSFLVPSPAIPDNDLGWELTAGCTWQLLERFVAGLRVAYWVPGKWFNYACIDRSVSNWDSPGPANHWGINPDREIDPVLGMEFRLSASF